MLRIKELRKNKGLSLKKLGEELGVAESTMSLYENEKRQVDYSTLIKLSNIFDVTIDYLLGNDDTKLPEGAIPVDVSTFIKIPVYGEVSAGTGCFAENHIIGYEYISPDSISQYEEYFFLKVKGDSMEPQICNGDYALIQKQTSIDSGSIAVVIIDNEDGVIKKVNYGSDWIELVSFNPYYPPRRFEGSDVQRISVVGLVKEIKRKF